jgi:hypothetical protein
MYLINLDSTAMHPRDHFSTDEQLPHLFQGMQNFHAVQIQKSVARLNQQLILIHLMSFHFTFRLMNLFEQHWSSIPLDIGANMFFMIVGNEFAIGNKVLFCPQKTTRKLIIKVVYPP